MATPSEYADRYRNLKVGFAEGDVTVTIQRYHLGDPDGEADILVQSVKEFFDSHVKKDHTFKLDLVVNGKPLSTTFIEVKGHIAAPFWGKGSPEDCQIAAQLAVMMKRTTRENLPRYCDTHLGLDCSGFVGNYLVHEMNKTGLGPSSAMDKFVAAGQPVKDIKAINPANIHVFVEVDDDLNVISGGKAGAGHIVITEPNKYTPTSFVVNSFGGFDLGWANKGAYGHPALWAVESTGPQGAIGLKESWYAIKRSVATRRQVNRGIYEVFRGSKGENLNFELVAFPPPKAAAN